MVEVLLFIVTNTLMLKSAGGGMLQVLGFAGHVRCFALPSSCEFEV